MSATMLQPGTAIELTSAAGVGRGAENAIRLDSDTTVSGRHATLDTRPDGLWVEDAGFERDGDAGLHDAFISASLGCPVDIGANRLARSRYRAEPPTKKWTRKFYAQSASMHRGGG